MNRSHSSFNAVFLEHYPRLVTFCGTHRTNGAWDPEDIVHLVYLKCRSHWRGDRCVHQRSSYLYQAARWVLADLQRKERRRHASTQAMYNALKGAQFRRPQNHLLWSECLASLSGRPRQAVLALLEGKNLPVIQQELGVSRAALLVALHRARRSLLLVLRPPSCKPASQGEPTFRNVVDCE